MLEDTSFAIHPDKEGRGRIKTYRKIGNVLEYNVINNVYQLACESGYVAIHFFLPSIIHIVMNPKQQPNLQKSKAVISTPEIVKVREEFGEDFLKLCSSKLEVEVTLKPFHIIIKDLEGNVLFDEGDRGMGYFPSSGEIIAYGRMHPDDHFYGFGEKTGHLDKRGEKFVMWNTDVYAPHNPETDPLYVSIPYFMTLRNGRAHGVFFDNTHRTIFDMKTEQTYYSMHAEGGQLDLYVMAGPTPKEVLDQYTYLTGKMTLPPKWAIGYHQSRYSYETEVEVRELASIFMEKDIPIDAIYLDIHYMNGYRVFTFNEDNFPNPEKLIKELREKGIRVVPIVDPGVKKDSRYSIYQEGVKQDFFCKYIEGDIYYGDVWPGTSAFPDFTDEKVRNWWGDNHQFYIKLGIEGIWNDMNEPAVFNETKTMDVDVMHRNDGEPATHKELHNVYGLLMGKATYEGLLKQLNGKRPFLLTRAGYAGIQRYGAIWTGDNRSFWEHLQMSLPMVMNLGLSGVAFAGCDVGGFAHDTNAELLTRWVQVGAFTPYFRNHSAIGFAYQEPWRFGEPYESIMKKYIQKRYEWLPQLYSLFNEASKTGLPVMRPLFLEYPQDPNTYNLNDQFMIGDNVLIAPILAPSVKDRAVYFPRGEWVEIETGKVYEGEKVHLIHAELDYLPIFIRRGSGIFQGKWKSNIEKLDNERTLHVFATDREEKYILNYYDDDGETFAYKNGDFLELKLELLFNKDTIMINSLEKKGNFVPKYSHIQVIIHQLGEGQRVIVDGKEQNVQNLLLPISELSAN
jgi:alpha-glucosidase